jgi:glycosyltransferase involved in cell wall biosynthesis
VRVLLYCADQNPHRDRSLGVTEYTRGLVASLATRSDIALRCLVSRSSFRPEGTHCESLAFRTDGTAGRLAADHLHPFLVRTHAELWHYPKGFLPLSGGSTVPRVGTIHDVILQHYADRYPTTRGRVELAYWLRVLRSSIPRFDVVLTVSEVSSKAIQEYCDRFRLRCPAVVVTYQGSLWESESPRIAPKGDYVLHLASRHPHKRTATLLELWARAPRLGSLPRLELVGPHDGQFGRAAAGVGARWHAPLTREALKDKIAGAQALIVSSEIEGFCLPALEAYYLGTPVLFVRGTAVEEIAGASTPGRFDLDDQGSFYDALDETLSWPAQSIARRSAALREKYSLSACAERTVAAYRGVARVDSNSANA